MGSNPIWDSDFFPSPPQINIMLLLFHLQYNNNNNEHDDDDDNDNNPGPHIYLQFFFIAVDHLQLLNDCGVILKKVLAAT